MNVKLLSQQKGPSPQPRQLVVKDVLIFFFNVSLTKSLTFSFLLLTMININLIKLQKR